MSSIDLDLLVQNLGAYFRKNGAELFRKLLLEQPMSEVATTLSDVTDEIVLLDLVSSSILKPWKVDFEPTPNALKFKPRIGKTRASKADVSIIPKTLHKQFLAYRKAKGADPYNLPFEELLLDRVTEQARLDMDTHALFEGVYDADGNGPADTMVGWLTHLDLAQAENAFEEKTVDIETITKANAIDMVERLVEGIPSPYLKNPMKLFCSPTVERYYALDYRERYGALPYNKEFQKNMIDGTMIEFHSHSGISTKDKMFVTPAKNMVMMFDSMDDLSSLIVERNARAVNVMLDVNAGVDFATLDLVWYAKNKA